MSTIDGIETHRRRRKAIAFVLVSTVAGSSGGLFVRLPPFDPWTIVAWEAPFGALCAWVGVGEVPALATVAGGTMVLASIFGRVLLERRSRPRTSS